MYMPRAIIGKQTRWASSRVRRRRVFCVCPERTYIIFRRILYYVLFCTLHRRLSLSLYKYIFGPSLTPRKTRSIYLSRRRRTTRSLIKFDRFIFLHTSVCVCVYIRRVYKRASKSDTVITQRLVSATTTTRP